MKPLTQKTLFFPFQGLLYQAQPKLLPGGNPLKSRNAQPKEPRLSCFLLSPSLHFFSISHFVPASVCPLLHFSSLTPSWLNTHTHTHTPTCLTLCCYISCGVSEGLAPSTRKQHFATISHWRKDKRWRRSPVSLGEMEQWWNLSMWESDGVERGVKI